MMDLAEIAYRAKCVRVVIEAVRKFDGEVTQYKVAVLASALYEAATGKAADLSYEVAYALTADEIVEGERKR